MSQTWKTNNIRVCQGLFGVRRCIKPSLTTLKVACIDCLRAVFKDSWPRKVPDKVRYEAAREDLHSYPSLLHDPVVVDRLQQALVEEKRIL
eukprot:scaffold173976_cov18-Prasinocladus_malaysianus.AAC.1